MDILERIVIDKKTEVESKKRIMTEGYLRTSSMMDRVGYSLSDSLRQGSGIIAEFKRRSPSKDVINHKSSVGEVVRGYEEAGASGISVLTDTKYFGGSLDDLLQARDNLSIPLLRKEFIVDPYQIFEAKVFGADAILLIAAVLSPAEIDLFSKQANQLGMEVLLEVHNREELESSNLDYVNMVGVNNRNLKTFTVDLETSRKLSEIIPKEKISISESGISDHKAILDLKDYGFKGFLIGENFMKTEDPGLEADQFIKMLKDES